jgi:general secretion pathway protein D
MNYRHILLPMLSILATSVLLLQATAQTAPTAPPPRPSAPPPIQPPPEASAPEEQPVPAASNTPVAAPPAPGRPAPAIPAPQRVFVPPKTDPAEKIYSFKLEGADLETVMQTYCEWTGQIYLKNDAVKASITLQANNLTKKECIEVVEAILGMNNIALVPMGEKFLKVVTANAPGLEGHGGIVHYDPETAYAGTDRLATQIIHLKNVEIPEVENAVKQLMNPFGKILALTRSNSLMITDTEANILRARELIEFIDQASARIEPRIYQIKYADASEIAGKLNEIITMAQADQKKTSGAVVGNPAARTPPGVIRAIPPSTTPAPTQASISKTEGSTTLLIQGTVKVMADERTNIILIFSQEENFEFFDKIIEVLDVEVEPATTFEVVNLEYADAEELSSTLNDLIGAAQGSRSSSSGSSTSGSRAPSSSSSNRSSSSSSSNRSSFSSRTTTPSASSRSGSTGLVAPKAEAEDGAVDIENLSKLSENTKILADKRTNSILLMGEKKDIAAIKNVIASLDIMLEQVVIEAAIFEVTLGDELRHGIDWLYRSEKSDKVGAWDGQSLINSTNGIGTVAAGALTYYQNLYGINTQIAINLAASDSNVRLLSTPVIMTTDNTEARLSVGEQRPVVTSTSSYANSSGTQSSNYEYKDIGIQLTVTPRINPQRVVIMEILQQADQVGDEITIDGNQVPVILNREFEAQISVPDRGTVALGGLINTETRDSVTKIPLLGDIPFIGRYLFSSSSQEDRQTELVVLLTPYVLTDQAETLGKTERLYDATDMSKEDWEKQRGWSETTLKLREKPDQEGEVQ